MNIVKKLTLILLLTAGNIIEKPSLYAQATAEGSNLEKTLTEKAKNSSAIPGSIFNNILAQIEIPQSSINLVNGLTIKTPTLIKLPTNLQRGIALKGDILINEKDTEISVIYGFTNQNQEAFSLTIKLPSEWKLSDLSKELAYLDKIDLPNGKLIYTNFDYQDPQSKVDIKSGLNFVADVKLTGPFSIINKFIEHQKNLNGLVLEGDSVKFYGDIAQNITDSSFGAKVPLKIGINFENLAQNKQVQKDKNAVKIAQAIAKIIKQITSDEFKVDVSAPPSVGFTMGAGIDLLLATQKEALSFIADGELVAGAQEAFNMKGIMKGPLHLGNWLTLADGGIEIDWDFALISELAAVGVPLPFTGLGINGWVYFGKEGDKQAAANLAGGLRFKQGDSFPSEFALDGEIKNIDFKTIINFFAQKIAKKDISAKIPELKLSDLKIIAAPVRTSFAGKIYTAGLTFDGKARLFGTDGLISFNLNPDPANASVTGEGNFSAFSITDKGRTLFKLEGTKPGDNVKVGVTISAKNPEASQITADGTLSIPPLGITEKVSNLKLGLNELSGNFESKVGNILDADLAFKAMITNPMNSEVTIKFKQDFITLLKKAINQELNKFKIKYSKTNTERELEQKKADYKNLKCDKITDKWKIWDKKAQEHIKECTKLSGEITKLGLEVGAEKAKQTFDPEKIKEVLTEISRSIFIPALQAFNIKEIDASWKPSELFPVINTLEISIKVPKFSKTIRLNNVKFDFKNITKAIDSLADVIIEAVINELK